jgi:hypothetical protein
VVDAADIAVMPSRPSRGNLVLQKTEWLLLAPHSESGWKRVCPKGRSKHAASGATLTARAAAAAGAEMPQSLLPALSDASPLLQRRGMAFASIVGSCAQSLPAPGRIILVV